MAMIKKIRRGLSLIKNQGIKGLKTALAKKVLAQQGATTMWQAYQSEAFVLADQFDFAIEDQARSRQVQSENQGRPGN